MITNPRFLWLDGSSNSIGIGAAPESVNTENMLRIYGTLATSSGRTPRALYVTPTVNVPANSQGRIVEIGGTFVEAGSVSNHATLFGLAVSTPSITTGNATVSDTASLYVAGAMNAVVTGTNYAMWVAGGTSRFDGNVGIGTVPGTNLEVVGTSGKIELDADNAGLRITRTDANDAYQQFIVTGQTYTLGIDNSDDDKFVIKAGSGIGTGDGIVMDSSGGVFINDTANDKMTTGLTINQGAADDEILALKSSDVGHTFTDLAEATTYGNFHKISGAGGG